MTTKIESTTAEYVALRLYDIGRQVVPGLMLRAIGPGQFIKEIIGLVLARFVDEADDRDFNGFEYWVSLDEWAKWFGESSASGQTFSGFDSAQMGSAPNLISW